jgi:hypothetical protein
MAAVVVPSAAGGRRWRKSALSGSAGCCGANCLPPGGGGTAAALALRVGAAGGADGQDAGGRFVDLFGSATWMTLPAFRSSWPAAFRPVKPSLTLGYLPTSSGFATFHRFPDLPGVVS